MSRSTSKKRPNEPVSSSHRSVSASANTYTGYANSSKRLRSVVAHPMGLPLAALLNDKPLDRKYNVYSNNESSAAEEAAEEAATKKAAAEAFAKAVDNWYLPDKTSGAAAEATTTTTESEEAAAPAEAVTSAVVKAQSETALTKPLLEYLKKLAPSSMKVFGEGMIKDGHSKEGRIDILFCDEAETSAVTLIEFGVGNDKWFQKVDQSIGYVTTLLNNKANVLKAQFTEPMLLAVITLGKIEENEKIESLEARFGVFLCTPTKRPGNPDFRMSLLWRKETVGPSEASEAFGKLVHASARTVALRSVELDQDAYTCLGPNCFKIGNKVRLVSLLL